MKKSQSSYIVDIRSLSHEGRGITSIDNKTTFVHGALPEEKVACKIAKKHRRYYEAEVSQILQASSKRIEPKCAHYGICGGCSLQHLAFNEQLIFKQATLLEQLKHLGKVSPQEILSPLTGKQWSYRRRARLGVRFVRKKEKLLVGFREKFSNYLTDVSYCEVLDPIVSEQLKNINHLISTLKCYESIPQIEVSVGDDATALVFRHLENLSDEDLSKLKIFAQSHRFHVYLQPNPPAKISKIWPEDHFERLTYSLFEKRLQMYFHPMDFIQVNGEMNEKMVELAIEILQPSSSDTILDLFCGLGNFTLALALQAKKVVGVEGSKEMVERAYENAQINNIDNIEFYAGNLMAPSQILPWLKGTYDKILLDPPRAGAQEILPFLPALKPKTILYISCNPATLARDAGILVHTYGYKLQKAGIINMFPHTSHIEAAALFNA